MVSPSPRTDTLRVDGRRLWDSLMQIGEIGATSGGGCKRLALTDEDRAARELFLSWCRDAGAEISIDQVGNVFARRAGRNPARRAIATGSHLDTQPSGGKFDGIYGVLAGLEVMRTLNDRGIETDAPIDVVVWTNEEGYRYDPAMMGSGVFAGVFGLEDTLDKRDRDGLRLGDELARTGFAGELSPGGERVPEAYIEAHIEQGPVLEQRGNTIGVVTGVQGIQAAVLTIGGQEAHAGPTPMDTRADALLPAAELVLRLNELAGGIAEARATVGELVTLPGSRNVVPGQVRMTVDLRHPHADTLENLWQSARAVVEELRQRHPRCTFAWSDEWLSPVVPFDATLVDRLRRHTATLGYAWQDIVSGAGHDACYVARVAPTAMVFVPCEGGISHNEAERASADDLEAGANVLLLSLLELASEPAATPRTEN